MNGFGGFFQKPQAKKKSTREVVLAEVTNAVEGHSPQLHSQSVKKLVRFCNSVENSAEVMSAICEVMDKRCNASLPVLKCLKLVYICLTQAQTTFLPAAQAFAPEIETVALLSFGIVKDPYRDVIHKTATGLYKFLLNRGELPSAEALSLSTPKVSARPQQRPQPQQKPQPKPQEDLIGFAGGPEQDKPRVPAAFAGGRRTAEEIVAAKGTGEAESLLTFDDDDRQAFDSFGGSHGGETEDLIGFGTFADDVPAKPSQPPKSSGSLFGEFEEFAGDDLGQGNEGVFSLLGDDDDAELPETGVDGEDGETFDPFSQVQMKSGNAPKPVEQAKIEASGDEDDGELFDPFAGLPSKGSKPSSQENLFSPFQGQAQGSTGGEVFDPFGAAGAPIQQTKIDASGDESVDDADDFDPFGAAKAQPASKGSANPFVSPTQGSTGGTNPFVSGQPAAKSTSNNNLFDPFGAATNQNNQASGEKQQQDDVFDPFGAASANQNNQASGEKQQQDNVFDPFGAQPSNRPPKSGSFETLTTQPSSQGAVAMGLFDDEPAAPAPKPVAKASAPADEGEFDPFADFAAKSKAPAPEQVKKPAPAVRKNQGPQPAFNPFAQAKAKPKAQPQPSKNDDVFDPFGAIQQPVGPSKSSSSGLMDAFDAPKSTSSGGGSTGGVFDPFGAGSTGSASGSQSGGVFDPFGAIQPQQNQPPKTGSSGGLFDPFGAGTAAPPKPQAASQPKEDGGLFDPFAGLQQQPQKSAPLGTGSAGGQAPASDVFDPFAQLPAAPQAPGKNQPRPQPQPQPKSSSSKDTLLDLF